MIISIVNKKGGVGKTPFAFSIAKDLEYFLQSNDNSIIEKIYPEKAKILPTPKKIDNCVYDFGGFVEKGVLDIIKESNKIIVPCTSNYNSLLRTLETLNEIGNDGKVCILVTDYRDEKEKKQICETLESNFTDLNLFFFKFSKIIENSMSSGASFTELYNENNLSRLSYTNFFNEYQRLLNFIRKDK
ncbi:ParA family protein [Campylobacter coli]|nr:ParA family protein [Campylobacter coli]